VGSGNNRSGPGSREITGYPRPALRPQRTTGPGARAPDGTGARSTSACSRS